MKKSEKLLDAIGQIDDRLVEEAAHAGRNVTAFAAAKETSAVRHTKKKKKAAMYRWQGALAACAVLAVCVGIFSLLSSRGLILSPFGGSSESSEVTSEEAVAEAVMDVAAADQAVQQPEAEVSDVDWAARATTESSIVTNDEAKGAVEEAAAEEAAPKEQSTDSLQTEEKDEKLAEGSEELQTEKETLTESVETETQSSENELDAGQLPMLASELGGGIPTAAGTENLTSQESTSEQNVEITVRLLACSAESVTWELTNQDPARMLYYGTEWELEVKTEAGWQVAEPVDELVWEQPLYAVKPGKTVKETADIAIIYGQLSSGAYRLVRECELGEGENAQPYTLYVEFAVE